MGHRSAERGVIWEKGPKQAMLSLQCAMSEEENARRAAKGGSVPSIPGMQGRYVPHLRNDNMTSRIFKTRQKDANMSTGWSGSNEAAGVGKRKGGSEGGSAVEPWRIDNSNDSVYQPKR
jgi:hypothetical protein